MLDPQEQAKLNLEDFRTYRQKEHELWIAGGKALMVLHSAGVAAMLGFMQALVGKGQLNAFKYYGCTALVIYLVGTLTGLMVLRRRTEFSASMPMDHAAADNAQRSARNFTKAGVMFFMLASLLATAGVVFALN